MSIELYLTVSEAAKMLGVTKEVVKALVSEGLLGIYKAHPNDTRYLIPLSEIKTYQKRTVH